MEIGGKRPNYWRRHSNRAIHFMPKTNKLELVGLISSVSELVFELVFLVLWRGLNGLRASRDGLCMRERSMQAYLKPAQSTTTSFVSREECRTHFYMWHAGTKIVLLQPPPPPPLVSPHLVGLIYRHQPINHLSHLHLHPSGSWVGIHKQYFGKNQSFSHLFFLDEH
jgi:hypothetical protein